MATNMMELMKQIQQDQSEYMKNLHDMNKNINDKLNFMEAKISDLDKNPMENKITALEKKIDLQDDRQQQILATVVRLEQQIRKNNNLLFGDSIISMDNGTDINFENKTSEPYTPDNEENADGRINQSEILVESIEATQLQSPSNVAMFKNKERSCEGDDKHHDHFENTENDTGNVDEFVLIEARNNDEARNNSAGEATAYPVSENDSIKTSNCFSGDLSLLDDKLNIITDMYQSETKELEQLIMDIVAEVKMSIEEAVSVVSKRDTEQIYNNYMELTDIAEMNNDALNDIKEVIKNYVSKKTPIRLKTFQISPSYFSADQLSELNAELKRISETYKESNIFPIVKVVSDANKHPIVKRLIEGVHYEKINRSRNSLLFRFKFGNYDSEKSYIKNVIARYPNLPFNDIVQLCLRHCNKWEANYKIYDFTKPMVYNKRGEIVRFIM